MTTIIKNGTVVTADLTYKADVRVENGARNDRIAVLFHALDDIAEVVG